MRLLKGLIKELDMFWDKVLEQNQYTLDKIQAFIDTEYIIAVGAGDSYAAAVSWEGIEPSKVKALDPLEAISTGYLAAGIELSAILVAISISGRTRTVIEAAGRYRVLGGRTLCITANVFSPLAVMCNNIIDLVYGSTVEGVGGLRQAVLFSAIAGLRGHRVSKTSVKANDYLDEFDAITGVGSSYGVALYACLKLCEVFGQCNKCFSLEELLHAPIYALRPGSSILFFEPYLEESRVSEIISHLKSLGYRVKTVHAIRGRPWDTLILQTFWVLEALKNSIEKHQVEVPYFKRHVLLDELTEIIYA